MAKIFAFVTLLFFSVNVFSQSKEIVGPWIFQNREVVIHLFLKADGSIEERSGTANENIWNKSPRIGTYTYTKGKLIITWADKTIEKRSIKLKKNAAEIKYLDSHGKPLKTYIFLKIMDEEVIAN